MNRLTFPFTIVILILILDQVFKIWVKTHMYLGESIPVFTDWFYLHFTENEGMAFGMKLGGNTGKLVLSVFRIIAVIVMVVWLVTLSKKPRFDKWLAVCLALIIAGALGNILDSAFYGLIFSSSHYHQVATLFPPEGGYTGFLHGKVVDMLYFPLIESHYPDWFPWVGGEEFIFFRPVFNLADSSISVGVALLIIFQKRFFAKQEQK
ncbi:MAG: lipoprotein signal peptidase [Bacteroidetes bacterium]|nr:MAG: lipoprotein signal peptidase [Bacteroidota bacterium]